MKLIVLAVLVGIIALFAVTQVNAAKPVASATAVSDGTTVTLTAFDSITKADGLVAYSAGNGPTTLRETFPKSNVFVGSVPDNGFDTVRIVHWVSKRGGKWVTLCFCPVMRP